MSVRNLIKENIFFYLVLVRSSESYSLYKSSINLNCVVYILTVKNIVYNLSIKEIKRLYILYSLYKKAYTKVYMKKRQYKTENFSVLACWGKLSKKKKKASRLTFKDFSKERTKSKLCKRYA